MTKYFLRLNRKRQYDIMGALRGPDWNREHADQKRVKGLIVARIRAVVFGRNTYRPRWSWECRAIQTSAVWFNHPLTDGVIDQAAESIREVGRVTPHFIEHLADAVRACRNHRVWGGTASRLEAVLRAALTEKSP